MVVFRHTGHHINSAQLVFKAIHDLGAECMRVVLIKHDPRGIFCYHGVYPRKRFRVADNALLYYRAPHYRDSSHDGHTRVLLAFYTPSVTSKSLLISLLFLERPIFVFQTLSVWRSLVLALHLFRPACSWARWDNVHDFTSVFYPSETAGWSIFYLLLPPYIESASQHCHFYSAIYVGNPRTRPFHMVENLDQGRPRAVQRLILPKLARREL